VRYRFKMVSAADTAAAPEVRVRDVGAPVVPTGVVREASEVCDIVGDRVERRSRWPCPVRWALSL
jgi:hypothetical protein